MTRRKFGTGSPYERQAAYSRAVAQGAFVHVAGTTGYDYAAMTMPESIEAQIANCFATIRKTLEEAGASLEDVVRARYYVAERKDVDAAMTAIGRHFEGVDPAATMVICALIDPAMKIEIEVTAQRD